MAEKHMLAKPAKDVFQPLGVRDFETKLSDIFKDMEKREVDKKFKMADGTDIRVFGFRARKGIVLEGEAYIEITGFGGESGGKAYVHLRKDIFHRLESRKAFNKPRTPFKGNFIAAGMLDELGEHSEFQNISQVLELLNSQNITPRFYQSGSGYEGHVTIVKKKYELALKVKTLERGGMKEEDAVQKIFDHCKSPAAFLEELDEHKLEKESTILKGIMAKHKFADIDGLLFTWSYHPPAGPVEFASAMSGKNPNKIKKFIEEAISEADKEVKKWEEKVHEAYKLAQSSPNAAWQKSCDDDLMINSARLREERMHLENLRKVQEMLRSYQK